MKEKATSPPRQPEDISIFQRFAPLIAIFVVLTIIVASIIGAMMVVQHSKETVVQAANVAEVVKENLPGPKNQISERSQRQLVTMVRGYPHIIAIFISSYKYGKNENRYVFTWADRPNVRKVLDDIVTKNALEQSGPNGKSSEDLMRETMRDPDRASRLLRNSEEARSGLIKCTPINDVALLNESLKTIATGICIATIPPFESPPAMSIVLLTDSPLESVEEIAEMRRILLALQIDIYNRDFQGRETWAHP